MSASGAGPPAAGSGRKRRRRGSRGGRRRPEGGAVPVDLESLPGEEDELPAPVSRGAGAEDAETGELVELPDDAVLIEAGQAAAPAAATAAAGRGRRRRGRKPAGQRGEGRPGRTSPPGDEDLELSTEVDDEVDTEVARDQVILVNAHETRETRVAVVKAGRLVDVELVVDRFNSLVNDIYRGRIVNLEEAIGAAFVDFGQGRNGFLHASDVMSVYGEKDFTIDKLLTAQVDVDEWETGEAKQSIQSELEDDGAAGARAADAETEDERAVSKARKPGPAPRRRGRPRLPIADLLQKSQTVVVQITKDAIGDKGPTLTTYISIPGRFLVLMPSLARTGVSRKIDDEKERRRLRRILSSLEIPEGMGVIVRTAGIGQKKAELRRDLEYLLAAWADFKKRLKSGKGPAPLYQESDLSIRTMRDLFSRRTEKVVVDDAALCEKMRDFTQRLMPEQTERIVLHQGPRPIFHEYGVEQDFERVFARRVELPSGGSIVLEQTEALVAIDVNSGRTREEGAGFEDIALKTNLEAVSEIARQMRLRDLGGIIVLDFIDMARAGSRRQVERALRDALMTDRARNKLGRISQFGLLELTRQRLGPGIHKLLFDTCPTCRGSGQQRTVESRGQAILRRLGAALTLKGFSQVEVRARPEVIAYLRRNCLAQIKRLQVQHEREIVLIEVLDQVEDSVLRYLRTDGREVRPGGRRKR